MKDHRFIGALALVLFVSCVVDIARAQAVPTTRVTTCDPATPNNALCVTWTAINTDTNGGAVTGVTYRVEQRTGTTGTFATVATGAATQFYAKNLAPGTYFFRVYVNCTGCIESVPSNTASKDATPNPIQPNAPVIIIAATIRAGQPPVYRIIQSVNLGPNDVVFAAPASMRPVFAAR